MGQECALVIFLLCLTQCLVLTIQSINLGRFSLLLVRCQEKNVHHRFGRFRGLSPTEQLGQILLSINFQILSCHTPLLGFKGSPVILGAPALPQLPCTITSSSHLPQESRFKRKALITPESTFTKSSGLQPLWR